MAENIWETEFMQLGKTRFIFLSIFVFLQSTVEILELISVPDYGTNLMLYTYFHPICPHFSFFTYIWGRKQQGSSYKGLPWRAGPSAESTWDPRQAGCSIWFKAFSIEDGSTVFWWLTEKHVKTAKPAFLLRGDCWVPCSSSPQKMGKGLPLNPFWETDGLWTCLWYKITSYLMENKEEEP